MNWDDNKYVVNNTDIRTIDSNTLKLFFTKFYLGNYHPLTMLTYSLDYSVSKTEPSLNPKVFHTTNLILNLFNTLFVFIFIFLLFTGYQRIIKNNDHFRSGLIVATISAIFFGVSTLHVESVAWIAERKDVLFTFFFLASLIAYLLATCKRNLVWYIVSFLLFICSLLSKGQAVVLPIILVLIDFLRNRQLTNYKVILEKIPFFVLSLIFGIIALNAQTTSGALHGDAHNFIQRFVFANYGFVQYYLKLLVPINLSAFYPYPPLVSGSIPFKYWLYLIPSLGLIALMVIALKKWRLLSFGLWFFAINIVLVLQLLQVGGAIMADRYSYLPSVGLFFILGLGFLYVFDNYRNLRIPLFIATIAYLIFFISLTNKRVEVWKDSLTLWNDVISKNENTAEIWVNRANYKIELKDYKGAFDDYNKALTIRPEIAEALSGRGVARRNLGDFNGAIEDYNNAIAINPNESESYMNRGVSKASLNQYEEAILDFQKAIALDSTKAMAYSNIGSAMFRTGDYQGALRYFDKALALDKYCLEAIANRGGVKAQLGDNQGAIDDFGRAIILDPNYSMVYFNRALVRKNVSDWQGVIADCTKYITLNPKNPQAFYLRGESYIKINKIELACPDLQKSVALGYEYAANLLAQYCSGNH